MHNCMHKTWLTCDVRRQKKENFPLRLYALPMNENAFCQLSFGSTKLEAIIREHRHIVEQKNLMSVISLLLNHAGKICRCWLTSSVMHR